MLPGSGLKETMAGRFEKLRIGHWGAADLAEAFGIGREEAVELLVRQGGYPGAFPLRDDLLRWRSGMSNPAAANGGGE